jgi:DNA-binding LytR/AlgR family response regulator
MTIRCLAIDDEPLALELLADNIQSVPFLRLVASCSTAMEALQVMQQEQIELVFSDIQMPGLNGLQLISSLPVRPMFILITAHEKYAVEGYTLDVVDYLLKPVSYDRFVKACNKALERHNLRYVPNNSADTRDFIFVPEDYRMVRILLAEVVRFEADKDYIRVFFSNGKRPMLIRMSMKAMQDMVPTGYFLRIHKSHIVNIRNVTAVRKNTIFLGDEELPVGEQYRASVQQLVGGM